MLQTAELAYLGIAEAGALFRRRELSPVELTQALIERTERVNEKLVPYVTPTPELALEQARAAEAALLRGDDSSALLGIPVGIKDIVMTKGIRTTCGSALHEQWVPDVDAAVVERWRAAGAVMMGKLSTHEFALGLQPPEHILRPARNPWNPAHIPGGSSSGSGTALAAGFVFGAIGTDTGGSIRGPAAYCGISGLKPTYGRVSRYGIVTLAWSLDHAGPMARTAEDCAILLNALAGYDPRDPACANLPAPDYTEGLSHGISGRRIALPTNYFMETMTDDARNSLYAAVEVFRGLGATVDEITLPHAELAPALNAIMMPEAYAYHGKDLAESPNKYPTQLRNNFRSGGLYAASEYVQAQRARVLMRDACRDILSRYDLILTASQTSDAPAYEESIDPTFKRGRSYTGAFNMTGMPSMSIPAGFSSRGLPLGIMLSGRPFDEATVLQFAHAYQSATDWHQQHPDLDAPARPTSPTPQTQPPTRGEPVITPEVVLQRAAVAGLTMDETWLEQIATGMDGALAPLRGLELHAIRLVEPAVRFDATW
jgi:aspartyl-tRNA(Asn)/glutamyl-tRNA(Gln) amidotransferase subunit A